MEPEIGIQGYLTSTQGLGGTIKADATDFVVDEIPIPPPPAAEGAVTIATIRVRDWETNRLGRQLARSLRISRRRIGFAGTKDKRALSTRLLSFEGVPVDAVRALALKDVEILDAYGAARPLAIGDLLGNRFRIVVRDVDTGPGAAGARDERQPRGCGGA